MADTKISALTASTTPLAGTEVLPIVQSGTTKKVSVSDLTAGRSVAVGNLAVGPTAKQANNSFEVNANTSYAGFIQNTGFGVGGTPINPSTSYGLHIGFNRSNGNGESNLVWGSGPGALSDLVIAQWNGTTYSVHTILKKGGELNVANGNIEIGTAGKGVVMTNAAGTVTKRVRLNDAGDGLVFENP